ncbi:MAG: serine hydrolase [Armatimonadetes bacterium]|nr:serine hydrolase [Armatimonadota bacterium]
MDNYFPPPDSAGGWRTLKDAKALRQRAGVDKTRLEQAWEQCQRCSANSGLVIVRRGWLVSENYAGRASRMCNPDMASTGKCFTSIACGIMLKEFKDKIPQGLDTKVFTREFLPEAFPLDDPRKAEITLGQLLCMSAGFHGEGSSPGFADGKIVPLTPVPGQNIRDLDQSSLRTPLWCDPGKGYSYSSPAPHIASMVLRRVTGMELREYIDTRLAKPQGWGAWDYCLQRGDFLMPHANGAGSTALHATDAVRFAYCLARGGKWAGKQLVPPEYIALCNKMLPYNPHAPFSLQFEHNADGHVAGAPRDAFWKSGAGGFCLYVVPSLDLVLYKMGGGNFQYDPTYTKIPQPQQDTSRDTWKPTPRSLFHDGTLGGDDGLRRVLEMACASVVD